MPVTVNRSRQIDSTGLRARSIGAKPMVFRRRAEVPKIVCWTFILFAATLPFEAADLGFTSSSFSLAKVSGVLFIGSYLFYYNPLSRNRRLPHGSLPLACFLGYLAVFVANGFFLDRVYLRQFVEIFLTLTQLFALFWICSSLLQNEILARRVLMAFALAAMVSALGTLLHLPGFSTAIETRMGERITSLGFNPNFLAISMAIAAVILIGLQLETAGRSLHNRLLLVTLTLPILAIIVRTGSRAGLGAFAIGMATYLLPSGLSQRTLMTAVLFLFFAGTTTYMIIENPTVATRLEETYSGNIRDRKKIDTAAFQMALERPVLGWKPVVLWEELGRRVGRVFGTRDAHNLLFHLILEDGVIGAFPFLLGLYLCARCAWRARSGRFGMLPLALMLVILTANVAHTYLMRKPQWLVLAFIVAAGSVAQKQPFFVVRRPAARHR